MRSSGWPPVLQLGRSLAQGLKDGSTTSGGHGLGKDGAAMAEALEPIIGGSGFTGRAPGDKSRWSGRERDHVPLNPILVVEVSGDHITENRMGHGARLLQAGEDKRPESAGWIRSSN
jgi:hypothetical protein